MSIIHTQTASIADTVRSAFPFNVDKLPLSGPDNLRTPFYAMFRDDTQEAVGETCTGRYVPHTTDDVVALAEATEKAFDGAVDCQTHFRDAHCVRIQPTKNERLSVFGTVDNIWPRVFIRFGYDGRACQASLGFYRDMCRNMTMLSTVGACHVKIRHTSNLRAEMNSLVEQFSELRNSWENLSETVQAMGQTSINVTEFLATVRGREIPAAGRGKTQAEDQIRQIIARMEREQKLIERPVGIVGNPDAEVNGWIAYNAVQGYYQHDATKKAGQNSDYERILNAASKAEVKRAERIIVSLGA